MKLKNFNIPVVLIVMLAMIVLLSTYGKQNLDDLKEDPCDVIEWVPAKIYLNIDPNNDFNIYRKSNYQFYIPTKDYRNGIAPSANYCGGLSGNMDDRKNHVIILTVRVACRANSSKVFYIDSDSFNSGNLKIELPASGLSANAAIDFNLEITYSEEPDLRILNADFNIPQNDPFAENRVQYSRNIYFSDRWSSNIVQPVRVNLSGLEDVSNHDCLSCCSKSYPLSGVNIGDWIDLNEWKPF